MSAYLIIINFCLNILGYIYEISAIWYIAISIINSFLLVYYRVIIKIPIKSEFALVLFYHVYLITITILNDYSIYNCQNAIQVLLTIWLVNYIISVDLKTFLKASVNVCRLALPLNLLCCVLFKNGIVLASNGVGIYLLGNKNTMGMAIVMLSILNIMYAQLISGKKTTIRFNLICGGITILLTWSATAIVAFAIIVVYFLFSNFPSVKRVIYQISIKQISIIGILASIGINVFNIQEYFSLIIKNILHKNVTLSARTLIWQTTRNVLQDRLIFGYGFYDSELLKNAFFTPANSHSFFMETMLTGGIVGSTIMILLLMRFSKNVRNSSCDNVSAIIKLAYIIVLVEGLAESTNLSLNFYLILIISDRLKYIRSNMWIKQNTYSI